MPADNLCCHPTDVASCTVDKNEPIQPSLVTSLCDVIILIRKGRCSSLLQLVLVCCLLLQVDLDLWRGERNLLNKVQVLVPATCSNGFTATAACPEGPLNLDEIIQ